jgi:hypothetical protein
MVKAKQGQYELTDLVYVLDKHSCGLDLIHYYVLDVQRDHHDKSLLQSFRQFFPRSSTQYLWQVENYLLIN